MTSPCRIRPEPVTLRGAGADAATRPGRSPVQWKRGLARVGRSLWNDKVAAAHTVFYLISAAIFLPLVAGMFLFMQDTADAPPDPTRGLDSRARSVLHQITSNPGLDKSGSTYWEQFGTGLKIDEVGIRDEESSMLSYAKVDNLQRGGLVKDVTDPWLNYEEFRGAMRLGEDINFHIRMSPVILNPSSDPYGTKPLAGMHVAYVARLGDDGLGEGDYMVDHQFPDLSPQAEKEIAALKALGLQTDPSDPNNGFDGKFYQPHNADTTLYTKTPPLPALPEPGYTNTGVQTGDVIADTDRRYRDAVTGGTLQTYPEWFWEDYFTKADGTFRYDAVVFGGGVDLGRFNETQQLRDFVEDGGVLIFMGENGGSMRTVLYDCRGDKVCLFNSQGTQQAPTTPDSTNQMLFVPNKLAQTTLDANRFKVGGQDDAWPVCDHSATGGVEERKGFIPISTEMPIANPCVYTHFGATSADRFGPNGGTVILTQWDTSGAQVEEVEVTKMFANLLSYGLLRPVYLDYGPEIPIDAPVVTSERLNMVQFPNGDYMDVKIWIYMWRGGCGGHAIGCVTP